MNIQKVSFIFIFALLLAACNQQTVEDPINPKVNSEYNRSADITGEILKVDENKAQLLIQGNGFGLNDDGQGIIQLDEKFYSVETFEEDQYVEIWIDSQAHVKEKHNLPIISDVAKINFTPDKE